jgi:hypothetical protein
VRCVRYRDDPFPDSRFFNVQRDRWHRDNRVHCFVRVNGDRCIRRALRRRDRVRLAWGREREWRLRDHRVREPVQERRHGVQGRDMCREA